MSFKDNEILFLLGAGASIDAGIPASKEMISKIESLIKEDDDWKRFESLYHYIKSAILYSEGIKGRHDPDNYNIEKLVNTLDEILKSDEHPLYPFIGSWAPKLPEVAGANLVLVKTFRKEIVRRLRDEWIQLRLNENADYYKAFLDFQAEYGHRLHIFSLNYDLCIEIACTKAKVERGFGDGTSWDWRIFESEPENQKDLFLYKLHGSIDWFRNDNGALTYLDGTSHIDMEKLEIIFGTAYKLQYLDPFLFFTYEFRKRTLIDGRLLIITIGYGFADEHINGIIGQALKSSDQKKLLCIIGPCDDKEKEGDKIKKKIQVDSAECIECWNMSAKECFQNHLKIEELATVFPSEEDPFEDNQQT